MKRPKGISESDLLSQIAQLRMKPSDPGLTVLEMAERTGRSTNLIRATLNIARAGGRLVLGFRHATRLDGRTCPVPVYRVVGEGPRAGRARRSVRDTPKGRRHGSAR